MKIGIMADIHGNAPALKAVLAACEGRVDKILFLGDIAGYYAFVNECVAMWDRNRIIGIRGNHDEVMLQCIRQNKPPEDGYYKQYGSGLERSRQNLSEDARLLLQSLPLQRQISLSSVSIAMYHGAPWNPLEERIYPDFKDWYRFGTCKEDIILMGHSHYPLVKRLGSKLIINPGSVGQPRDNSSGACYAELDLASAEVKLCRAAYDATAIIDDSIRHDPDKKYLVEVLKR